MVKHIQTICRLLPTNRLSMFDHFVVLVLNRLKSLTFYRAQNYRIIKQVAIQFVKTQYQSRLYQVVFFAYHPKYKLVLTTCVSTQMRPIFY